MATEFDFTFATLGDFRENEEVQTASLDAKEQLYDSFFNFHEVPEQQRKPFLALMRQDHVGFNSSGQRRDFAFKKAQLLREHISTVSTVADDDDARRRAHLDYVKGLKSLQSEEKEARKNRSEALQAAAGFERINNLRSKASPTIFNRTPSEEFKTLDDQRNDSLTKLRKVGASPIATDEGTIEGEFDNLRQEAEEITSLTGAPIFVDRDGQAHIRPSALIRDFEGSKQAIQESDLPRLEKRAALDGLEGQRDRNVDVLIDSVSVARGGITDLLAKAELDLGDEAKGEEGAKKIRQKVAADVLNEEAEKSDFSRFISRNISALDSGLQDLGNLPASLIEGTFGARILDEDREAQAAQSQAQAFATSSGGITQFSEAVSRELPALFVTRGVGSGVLKLGKFSILSPVGQRRLATTAALGFGSSRSASFNIQELIESGATQEEVMAAGMLGFATTFLTSGAFSAAGAGGVESFGRNRELMKRALSSGLKNKLAEMGKIIGKNAFAEGAEEFIDEFANFAIVNGFKNLEDKRDPADALGDSFFAAGVGALFGGATAVPQLSAARGSAQGFFAVLEDNELNDEELTSAVNILSNGGFEQNPEGAKALVNRINERVKSEEESPSEAPSPENVNISELDTDSLEALANESLQQGVTTLEDETLSSEETLDRLENEVDKLDVDVDNESLAEVGLVEPDAVVETVAEETPSGPSETTEDTQEAREEIANLPDAGSNPAPPSIPTQDSEAAGRSVAGDLLPQIFNQDVEAVAQARQDLSDKPEALKGFDDFIDLIEPESGLARQAITEAETAPETTLSEDSTADLSEQVAPSESELASVENDVQPELEPEGEPSDQEPAGPTLDDQIDDFEEELDAAVDRGDLDLDRAAELSGQSPRNVDELNELRESAGLPPVASSDTALDEDQQEKSINKIFSEFTEDQQEAFTDVEFDFPEAQLLQVAEAIRDGKPIPEVNQRLLDKELFKKSAARTTSTPRGSGFSFTPATESQRTFSEAQSRSIAYLTVKNGGPVNIVSPDNKALQDMVSLAEEHFGARVVFFEGDGTSLDGAYDDGLILVNVNSTRPLQVVLGHEMAHALEVSNPVLFAEIEAALLNKTVADRYTNYLDAAEITENYRPSQYQAEFIADVIGTALSNPKAVNRLADVLGDQNSSLWKKIGDFISDQILGLMSRLKDRVSSILNLRVADAQNALTALESNWDAFSAIERAASRWQRRPNREVKRFDVSEADPLGDSVARVREARRKNPRARVFAKSKVGEVNQTEQGAGSRSIIDVKIAQDIERDLVIDADKMAEIVQEETGLNPETATADQARKLLTDFILDNEGLRQRVADQIRRFYGNKNPHLPDVKVDASGIFAGDMVAQLLLRTAFQLSNSANPVEGFRLFQAVSNNIDLISAYEGKIDDVTRLGGQLLHARGRTLAGMNVEIIEDFRAAAESFMADSLGTEGRLLLDKVIATRGKSFNQAVEEVGAGPAFEQGRQQLLQAHTALENQMKVLRDAIATARGQSPRFRASKKRGKSNVGNLDPLDMLDAYFEAFESVDENNVFEAIESASQVLEGLDLSNVVSDEAANAADAAKKQAKKNRKKKNQTKAQGSEADLTEADKFLSKLLVNFEARNSKEAKEKSKRLSFKERFYRIEKEFINGSLDFDQFVEALQGNEDTATAFADGSFDRGLLEDVVTKRKDEVAQKKAEAKARSDQRKAEKASTKKPEGLTLVDQLLKDAESSRLRREQGPPPKSTRKRFAELEKSFRNGDQTFDEFLDDLRNDPDIGSLFSEAVVPASKLEDAVRARKAEADIRAQEAKARAAERKKTSKPARDAARKKKETDQLSLAPQSQAERVAEKIGLFNDFRGLSLEDQVARVQDALPAALKSQAQEVTDTFRGHSDNDVSISEVNDLLAAIRKQGRAAKVSLEKLISDFALSDPAFRYQGVDTKIDLIVKFLEANGKDPGAVQTAMQDLVKGAAVTDEARRRAAERWLRQVDAALTKVAEPLAKELGALLKGDKNILPAGTLTKAIRLGLLEDGSDLNYLVGRALGKDFFLDPKTQKSVFETQAKIVDLVNQGLGNSRQVQLLRQQQLVAISKKANLGPKFWNLAASGIRASMYSNPSTWALSFFAGGVGALEVYTSEYLEASFDIAKRLTAGESVNVGEELGDLVGVALRSLGVSPRFVSDASGPELRRALRSGPLDTGSTDFFNGTKQPGAIVLSTDGVNGKQEGKQQIIEISDLSKSWNANLGQIKGLLEKKNSGQTLSLKEKAKIATAGAKMAYATQEIVWRILGSIDGASIDFLEKSIQEFNLLRHVRRGDITRQELRNAMEATAGLAQSHFDAVRQDYPELSPRAARVFVRERVEHDFRRTLAQETSFTPEQIEEIFEDANDEAVALIGNHNEVIGAFSALAQLINRGVSKLSRMAEEGDNSVKRLGGRLGVILQPLITGPITIPANIADRATWLIPGLGLAAHYWADKSLKAGNQPAFFRKLAGTDRKLQRRKIESVIGLAAASVLMGIQALFGSDDEDFIEFTTSFPSDDAVERARWKGPPPLAEYSVYVGFGEERFKIQYTRGVLQRLTYPFLLAGRAQEIGKGKTPLSAMHGLTGDVARVSLPAVSSTTRFYNTVDNASEKEFKRQIGFRASSLLPFSGATRAVADVRGGRVQQTDENALLANIPLYVAIVGADGLNSVEYMDAFGRPIRDIGGFDNQVATLMNRFLPVGFLPGRALDELSPEQREAKTLTDKLGYYPNTRKTYQSFLKETEDLSDGQWQRLLKRNEVSSKGEFFQKFELAEFSQRFSEDVLKGRNKRASKRAEVRDSLSQLEKTLDGHLDSGNVKKQRETKKNARKRFSNFSSNARKKLRKETGLSKELRKASKAAQEALIE